MSDFTDALTSQNAYWRAVFEKASKMEDAEDAQFEADIQRYAKLTDLGVKVVYGALGVSILALLVKTGRKESSR